MTHERTIQIAAMALACSLILFLFLGGVYNSVMLWIVASALALLVLLLVAHGKRASWLPRSSSIAAALLGLLYGFTFSTLLGGLGGGSITWALFGAVVVFSATLFAQPWQRLAAATLLGMLGGGLLLGFAHATGASDPDLLVLGLVVWTVLGGLFGLLGALLGLIWASVRRTAR